MKTIRLIAIVLFGVIITSAAGAIAKPGGGLRHHEEEEFSLLSRIELSSEQKEKINHLRTAFEKSVAHLRLRQQQTKAELAMFWLQLTPDIEKIRSAQKEMHDIRFQIAVKETDFKMSLRQVLTEDQLTRFLALGGGRHQGPVKSAVRSSRTDYTKID